MPRSIGMISEDSSDLVYHAPTNLIIVPTSPDYGHKQRKCRCGSPRRSSPPRRCSMGSPGKTFVVGSSKYDPVNYLTKGGERARDKANEEKLMKLNKAAMKDLQLANNTLAQQLVRMQAEGGEERQAMKGEVMKLELLLEAQSNKSEKLEQQLTAAQKQNMAAEDKHHCRLKEIARRLKEEHLIKLRPLQEAHDQLLAELTERREDNEQMQQLKLQLSKLSSRLEMESSSRAELWTRCSNLEKELQTTQEKLVVSKSGLKQAQLQTEHLSDVEQQLTAVQESLQSERVAHSKLQADATLERSTTAALKVELERLRRDLLTVTRQAEQADTERTTLKAALADSQSAASDAAVDVRTANARAARLEQELTMLREEADKQAVSLRSQSAAREERISAQAASRLAQLQSELDAKGASAAVAEEALATSRAEVTRLSSQVESLRHAHDAASSQLLASQEQAEQLEGQVTDLICQLKSAKGTGFKQEAAIAELLAKHKSNSQSWQQEKQQLQVSATQWRQRAVQLQEELEHKAEQAVASSQSYTHELANVQGVLDETAAELSTTKKKLAAVEEERTAAAKRSRELLAQWEERDKLQGQDLSSLRVKVSELLGENDAMRSEAERYRQQLRLKEQDLEATSVALADAQARFAALHEQLGAAEKDKSAEAQARLKGMQELSAALQAEQQARLDAQLELNKARKRQSAMEAQLQQSRVQALSQVFEAKAKAEEAANSAAALAAADRKAKQYRRDDNNMLNDYDSWVQGLLAKKGAAAVSPRAASAAPASSASPVGLKSPAATATASPRMAVGSFSRSNSAAASSSQVTGASPAAQLDKYDRIAAMLESRGVGAESIGRSVSARSLSFNAGAVGEKRNVGSAGPI